jgi:hypothetical protein
MHANKEMKKKGGGGKHLLRKRSRRRPAREVTTWACSPNSLRLYTKYFPNLPKCAVSNICCYKFSITFFIQRDSLEERYLMSSWSCKTLPLWSKNRKGEVEFNHHHLCDCSWRTMIKDSWFILSMQHNAFSWDGSQPSPGQSGTVNHDALSSPRPLVKYRLDTLGISPPLPTGHCEERGT